jgi:hypothetical protein
MRHQTPVGFGSPGGSDAPTPFNAACGESDAGLRDGLRRSALGVGSQVFRMQLARAIGGCANCSDVKAVSTSIDRVRFEG